MEEGGRRWKIDKDLICIYIGIPQLPPFNSYASFTVSTSSGTAIYRLSIEKIHPLLVSIRIWRFFKFQFLRIFFCFARKKTSFFLLFKISILGLSIFKKDVFYIFRRMLFWCVFQTCFWFSTYMFFQPKGQSNKCTFLPTIIHIFTNNRVSIHAFTGFLFLFFCFVRQD